MWLDYLMMAALPAVGALGIVVGRRQRCHIHEWTQWSYKWDADKQTLTKIQERSCKTCGFHEESDPAPKKMCPPHRWGKWYEISLRSGAAGQQRDCQDCGVGQLRKLETGADV